MGILALAMIRISDISLQRPVVKYFSYILGLCRRDPLRALVPVRPLPGFGPPPIPKSKGSLSREEKFGSGRSCTHPPVITRRRRLHHRKLCRFLLLHPKPLAELKEFAPAEVVLCAGEDHLLLCSEVGLDDIRQAGERRHPRLIPERDRLKAGKHVTYIAMLADRLPDLLRGHTPE